jgi:hypothetical protein
VRVGAHGLVGRFRKRTCPVALLGREVWHAGAFVSTKGKHNENDDVISGGIAMFLMSAGQKGCALKFGCEPWSGADLQATANGR